MTARLALSDITDLRAYERDRDAFRREVIDLKRIRRVPIGPLVSVVAENWTTLRFQVQEMVRAERILEDDRVQAELDVYNPLLPGPGELSLTLFLELTSEDLLRAWLPKLVGIERAVVLAIGEGGGRVEVRDEVDPDHAALLTRDKVTASVHYVRIRLAVSDRARFLAERVTLGIDHPEYHYETELSTATKASVVGDW